MNNQAHDLTILPGPHFGGQLPPLEWRNGYPYIAPQANAHYSICPDGAPDCFCILTKPANGLVATCVILASEKTCDTTTGRSESGAPNQASLTKEGEGIALGWSLGGVLLQTTAGALGLVVLLVGVAAKGSFEYVIRPLWLAGWAYITRTPKRDLPNLRDVRIPEKGRGYQSSNNVFHGGTHYHVHNY